MFITFTAVKLTGILLLFAEHWIGRKAEYDKQTQFAKIRDSSPISTHEAINASSVADAPCGGNEYFWKPSKN